MAKPTSSRPSRGTAAPTFDIAVVGGGALGCATALRLARAGLGVVVFERRGLSQEASGSNAGSLCLQIKPLALLPYALQALALWQTPETWLGLKGAGMRRTGSLMVAFNDDDAVMLAQRSAERAAAGVPLALVSSARARTLEPALGPAVRAASFCETDGFADPGTLARAFATLLPAAGVSVRVRTAVVGIGREDRGFVLLGADGAVLARARRLLLAGGAWTARMAGWLGATVPVFCRPYQMAVTERVGPSLRRFVGLISARLSLKQAGNGSFVIGGGWPAAGGPGQAASAVLAPHVIGNLRLAHMAVPALGQARLVRTWVGLEAELPDTLPAVGPLPGLSDAFVVTAVRSGFTLAPAFSALAADIILGRATAPAAFDPGRFVSQPGS